MVRLLIGLMLLFPVHMHDRADLDDYFSHLQSRKGSQCCGLSDGLAVKDPDWDTENGHYRVKVWGEWLIVPDEGLVDGPNKYGPAIVWPYRDSVGIPRIRCFLPGAGT